MGWYDGSITWWEAFDKEWWRGHHEKTIPYNRSKRDNVRLDALASVSETFRHYTFPRLKSPRKTRKSKKDLTVEMFFDYNHQMMLGHLKSLANKRDVKGILVALHFVPRRGFVKLRTGYKRGDTSALALMGSDRLQEHLMRSKVIGGVVGHAHSPVDRMVRGVPVFGVSGGIEPGQSQQPHIIDAFFRKRKGWRLEHHSFDEIKNGKFSP